MSKNFTDLFSIFCLSYSAITNSSPCLILSGSKYSSSNSISPFDNPLILVLTDLKRVANPIIAIVNATITLYYLPKNGTVYIGSKNKSNPLW